MKDALRGKCQVPTADQASQLGSCAAHTSCTVIQPRGQGTGFGDPPPGMRLSQPTTNPLHISVLMGLVTLSWAVWPEGTVGVGHRYRLGHFPL